MALEFLRPKGITVYTYPQQVGDISNSPTPIMLDSTRETTSTSHVTGLPKTGSSVDYFRTSNSKIVLKSIDIKVTMCFFSNCKKPFISAVNILCLVRHYHRDIYEQWVKGNSFVCFFFV